MFSDAEITRELCERRLRMFLFMHEALTGVNNVFGYMMYKDYKELYGDADDPIMKNHSICQGYDSKGRPVSCVRMIRDCSHCHEELTHSLIDDSLPEGFMPAGVCDPAVWTVSNKECAELKLAFAAEHSRHGESLKELVQNTMDDSDGDTPVEGNKDKDSSKGSRRTKAQRASSGQSLCLTNADEIDETENNKKLTIRTYRRFKKDTFPSIYLVEGDDV